MNFGISEIDISTFFLLRSRVLHIKISEIVKREIPLEEHFDISAFRHFGIRNLEETVIWNREFRTPGSQNPREKKIISAFQDLKYQKSWGQGAWALAFRILKLRDPGYCEVVFWHFRNWDFGIPVDKNSDTSHENPQNCEMQNSVKWHFGNSVFRGSGTREDSFLGSRVLDSRYPKV